MAYRYFEMPNSGCARTTLGLTLLVFTSILSSGCGGSDDDSRNGAVIGNYGLPVAGCEQYDTNGCDITQPACQQEIFGLVKCIRSTPSGTLPTLTTITTAQYRDKLVASNADANAADLDRLENALMLLGLAKNGDLTVQSQVDVLVNTVPAYYNSDEKTVYIVSPDTPSTANYRREQSLTLAHEFTHALQDESYDLNQFGADNYKSYDSALAAKSVVEGEAELYQTLLQVAFDGLTLEQVSLTERYTNAANYVLKQYADVSPYLIAHRMFPYYYGAPYVNLVLQAQGRAGIDGLFAHPPESSLSYILSRTSLVETILEPVSANALIPPDGAVLYSEDTLGAWLTYQYLNRMSGGILVAEQAVANWRGDHLWIYGDANSAASGNVAVVWRVRFSNPADINNFIWTTRTASVIDPNNNGSARRIVFQLGADVVVVCTAGAFQSANWYAAVTAAETSTGTPTGANTGTASAPVRAPTVRSLIAPVPRAVP